MDCFAALAMTSERTFTASPRHAPEALLYLPPIEGVGNAGCPLHPRPPGFRFALSGLRWSPTLLREATCPPWFVGWVEPFAKPIALAHDGYRFRSTHPARYAVSVRRVTAACERGY